MEENRKHIAAFLQNVVFLRKRHGLSKREMARRLDIGLYTLNKIERGELPARLGGSVFLSVYREFGVLPSAMIGQKPEDQSGV